MSGERHLLCIYPWLALGGADKFNLDLLRCLRARGWRATIVTTLPHAHPWRVAFEAVSDEIVDLATYPPEQYPARLLHIARTHAVDAVLISNSSLGYHLLPYLRAHLPHLTYVDYCHMADPDWRDGGYPRMSLRYGHLLDLQIVSSQQLKQWMCERGGNPDRIEVCTTNIDASDWDPARYDRQALRQALGIAPTAAVVLYAGRLERQKQPLVAASVMRQVARQAPAACFLVAGEGQYAGYLRGQLRWHGLERQVKLLGAVSNQRIRELLALSDIFFLPSQMEGISLAIYEAMAMGVVPLAAAVGGQAELVTAECGVLVARGPTERAAYAAALLRLLKQPALLQQMSAAARRRVGAHFRLADMGARMDELLGQAQALHHAQPRPAPNAGAALQAGRCAIAAARTDQAELRHYTSAPSTPRQRLRALYWQLVDRGAWWLVPAVEGLRQMRNKA